MVAQALITQSKIERGNRAVNCKRLAEEALSLQIDNRRVKARARICLAMALLQPQTYDYARSRRLIDEAADLMQPAYQDYLREEFEEARNRIDRPTVGSKLVIPLTEFYEGAEAEHKAGKSRLESALQKIESVVVREVDRLEGRPGIGRLADLLGTDPRRVNKALSREAPDGWLREEDADTC